MAEDLEEIASKHDQTVGFTPRLIECRANTLAQLLLPGDVLDLGCADGLLTERLANRHRSVTAIDASAIRVDRTRRRIEGRSNVTVLQSNFETFDPGPRRFDAIVLSCVLEHLDDPVWVLAHVSRWLSRGGKIVAIVPNAESLHRRAGVLMSIIPTLHASDHSDHELGHHRMYTLQSLRTDFESAGLDVVEIGGHLIKPLPNDEMARLKPELVTAYERLGRQMPELSAEIFAAAKLP